MKAKYVILSVLNKQELFYLKSRYKEMKKLANKHEVSLVEQNFIDAIISMVGYCSLGFGLVSIVNGILLVFSFFRIICWKVFFCLQSLVLPCSLFLSYTENWILNSLTNYASKCFILKLSYSVIVFLHQL